MALPPQATHLLAQTHGVVSASTEFGYPNSGMLLRHYLSKHRLCVHTWLSEHRRLRPHDLVRANP